MAAGHDAQKVAERVEALLAKLGSQAGPEVAATAEELVSCLVELYGAGLAEIVKIIGEDPDAGRRLMDRLAGDPLVESLLLLHDLHPLPAADRVQRAIDQIMPQLGGSHAGQVTFDGVDETGVIHLHLERGSHGCGSSPEAVQAAIEQAVAEAAPEAAGVEVEAVTATPELPLLQITRHPAAARGVR
jgi:Fe-S cluster biogenesis protein NfuA